MSSSSSLFLLSHPPLSSSSCRNNNYYYNNTNNKGINSRNYYCNSKPIITTLFLNPILHFHHHQQNKDYYLLCSERFRESSCCSGEGDTSVCIGVRVCIYIVLAAALASASSRPSIAFAYTHPLLQQQCLQDNEVENSTATMENIDDDELKAAFEKWKSKTYPLTVPLRVVALQGSVPPSWITDFIQSQGKRAKLRSEIRSNLPDIFSNLCTNLSKETFDSKSVTAADIVTIGDSWLSFAIQKNLVEPIEGVEDQDWYRGLSDKWKVYLRRNSHGNLDPEGCTWAAPYRWGSMVIAYKKNKFKIHNLAPIEDWADLWRPELAGKISMINSPREIIGAVLKSMGKSYNTTEINVQVKGGRKSVQKKLESLGKQVRLFDDVGYLRAFGVGDVWVAVGWSSDVIPAAKRMSGVSVIVPKSGASLWADLWAIPATSRLKTDQIEGRVRGPSPLVHQWIEFCLQAARALPFKQEIIAGASPTSLDGPSVEEPKEITNGKPKLDTNLINGVPPVDILDKCEFLEPLSDVAVADYEWLVAGMQKDREGLVDRMWRLFSSKFQIKWRINESEKNAR